MNPLDRQSKHSKPSKPRSATLLRSISRPPPLTISIIAGWTVGVKATWYRYAEAPTPYSTAEATYPEIPEERAKVKQKSETRSPKPRSVEISTNYRAIIAGTTGASSFHEVHSITDTSLRGSSTKAPQANCLCLYAARTERALFEV
jgi:hypothetical protein